MPTNEERREVAAKLRALAAANPGGLGIARVNAVLGESQRILGTRGLKSVAHVIERHADLIEPAPERTCRMEYDPVHCDYVCTACGEWHNTGMYDACDADDRVLLRPYRYCPECGARVEGCE